MREISPDTIFTRVLFFATLKERAGRKELKMELPENTTVSEFKALLGGLLPELAPSLETAVVSVNHEFAFGIDLIPPGAEVALFPPVSGG